MIDKPEGLLLSQAVALQLTRCLWLLEPLGLFGPLLAPKLALLGELFFAWLRCGIRWKNTAFLQPQSHI